MMVDVDWDRFMDALPLGIVMFFLGLAFGVCLS